MAQHVCFFFFFINILQNTIFNFFYLLSISTHIWAVECLGGAQLKFGGETLLCS